MNGQLILSLLLALAFVACAPKRVPVAYLQPVKEPGVSVLSGESLSVAGSVQPRSLVSVALRYSKDPNTQETIFGVGLTTQNTSALPVDFGPNDILLADSGLRLLPRLSEAWLENFFANAIREREIAASYVPPMPAYAPSYRVGLTQIPIGNTIYTYGSVGPDPYAALGQGIGMLLIGAIVAIDRAGAIMEMKELQRERQSILEGLLRPTVLLPKIQLQRSVYFYNPPKVTPQFPLKVIVRLGAELYLFHFTQSRGDGERPKE